MSVQSLAEARSVVKVQNLTRQFPGHPPTVALREAAFEIKAGDFVTVVGRSGSGKSTLLNILGLLDRPSEGGYDLNGRDVAHLSERDRTWIRGAEIGFVHQSFQLLSDRSAIDNVMMATLYRGASSRESSQSAMNALGMVGLDDRATQPPRLMSGGERQRVAIARAIAGRPSLLLCDEPTGNLDSRNSEAIIEIFQQLNSEGASIVLITHDRDIARVGNRLFTIVDGTVSE